MRLDENVVKNIIEEAVEIETVFITESISCAMLGMNIAMMKQYVRFVGDRLMIQLGYGKIYNVVNPFDFMESLRAGFTNPALRIELVIIVKRE